MMINYGHTSPETAAAILSPSRKPRLEWSATLGDNREKKWNWILDDIIEPRTQTNTDNPTSVLQDTQANTTIFLFKLAK